MITPAKSHPDGQQIKVQKTSVQDLPRYSRLVYLQINASIVHTIHKPTHPSDEYGN